MKIQPRWVVTPGKQQQQNVDDQVSKYFGLLVILNVFQRLKPQYMRSAMLLVSTKLQRVWFEVEELQQIYCQLI